MTNHRDPVWINQLERFGVKSLVKLILAVFALLFIAALASIVPGTSRLETSLPISVPAIVRSMVTLALLILLYKIATQAISIIEQIQTDSPEFRAVVAAVVYWGIVLLAIAIAYEGFHDVGLYLLARAGLAVFYPLLFGLMALIPLTFLLVEAGVFVQSKRQRGMDAQIQRQDIQSNEEQIYHLLKEHGGVVYQAEVAEATGWSKAKASRVLSNMETDGSITRYQIGREKVVCLPGHEPDSLSSVTDEYLYP